MEPPGGGCTGLRTQSSGLARIHSLVFGRAVTGPQPVENAAGQHNQMGMGPAPASAPSGTTAPGSQDRRSAVWRTSHLNLQFTPAGWRLSKVLRSKRNGQQHAEGFLFPEEHASAQDQSTVLGAGPPKGSPECNQVVSLSKDTGTEDLLSSGMCRCQGTAGADEQAPTLGGLHSRREKAKHKTSQTMGRPTGHKLNSHGFAKGGQAMADRAERVEVTTRLTA